MIAGRSGTLKSGFASWLVAEMNLPTLYFSADMSAYTASIRLACSRMRMSTSQVESLFKRPEGRREILDTLDRLNLSFSYGTPIRWSAVDDELLAYVELHNEYPKVIVFDNLMDIEDTESDYSMQMAAMQSLSDLSRATGATVIILHHASDKSWDAQSDPYGPPSRKEVKGGLSEKPELSLSVGINPHSHLYQIAVIKNRMGPQDPTANLRANFKAIPDQTRFEPWVEPPNVHGFARQH